MNKDSMSIRVETETLLIVARPRLNRVMITHKLMEWCYFMSCEEFCQICDKVTQPPTP